MFRNLQAVILAGGRGTRLGSLGDKIPKAMVNINGSPFIDLIINQLKKNRINKFLLLTGYRKNQLIDYFRENKDILTIKGNSNWQTLTRIKKAEKFIKSQFFLLMYCDNFLINFKIKKFFLLKKKYKSNIFFSVVKRKPGQKSTITLDKNKLVYKGNSNSNYVEVGYTLIKKKFFFENLTKYKGNKLSNYLQFLSKKNNFAGTYYGNNFLCIENKKLISETKKFFLKK
jgi:NDP-sugar pyrophosphorylase family protein